MRYKIDASCLSLQKPNMKYALFILFILVIIMLNSWIDERIIRVHPRTINATKFYPSLYALEIDGH